MDAGAGRLGVSARAVAGVAAAIRHPRGFSGRSRLGHFAGAALSLEQLSHKSGDLELEEDEGEGQRGRRSP